MSIKAEKTQKFTLRQQRYIALLASGRTQRQAAYGAQLN